MTDFRALISLLAKSAVEFIIVGGAAVLNLSQAGIARGQDNQLRAHRFLPGSFEAGQDAVVAAAVTAPQTPSQANQPPNQIRCGFVPSLLLVDINP